MTFEVITADLTDARQMQSVANRLQTEPAINILVNNARAQFSGGFSHADLSLSKVAERARRWSVGEISVADVGHALNMG
ncbi:hypothetical protein [Rhizobium sp. PL01]|uniref:hypothetical protein n=1 Tax=Rhizobium sp. PL01 TaxID=3085631 RepID=UPI00298211FF|nr:hypothetical protein [Rhizobium sp. PL01]MDW5317470.1 hypothetical protein [Rhizobium sp. PL01]